MMLKRKNLIVLSFLLIVGFFTFGSIGDLFAGDAIGVTDDQVNIAHITAMTGPAAFVGNTMIKATKVFFLDVNEKGGIHGRKIKVFYEDNAYQPLKTVAAAKYLFSKRKIFGMVDVLGSAPAMALLPFIMERKVPTIIPSARTAQTYIPPRRYVFVILTSSTVQGVVAMDYLIKDLKVKNLRIGCIHQDDQYGNDAYRGIEKAAKKYGFEITAEQVYKRGAVDFSSQVVNMKRAKPDYVYISGIPGPTSGILKEAYKLDWSPHFFGDGPSVTPKTIDLVGEAGKGLINVYEYGLGDEDIPGGNRLRKIVAKHAPEVKDIEAFFVWQWIANSVFLEGLKRSGRELTREGFVDILNRMKDFDTGGLIAPISFRPDKKNGGGSARMVKIDIKNRTYHPITGWRKPSVK